MKTIGVPKARGRSVPDADKGNGGGEETPTDNGTGLDPVLEELLSNPGAGKGRGRREQRLV